MSQLLAVDTVRALLEEARQKLVETDPNWDGRVCMNPWSVPTRDDCCNGQLQGTITRFYLSDTFPLDRFEAGVCAAPYFVADVTISVLACLVGMDNRGGPLKCEALDDATDKNMIQAAAVWSGVLCYLAGTDIEWIFREQVPLDNEQGQCMGSDLLLSLGFVNTGCSNCG